MGCGCRPQVSPQVGHRSQDQYMKGRQPQWRRVQDQHVKGRQPHWRHVQDQPHWRRTGGSRHWRHVKVRPPWELCQSLVVL